MRKRISRREMREIRRRCNHIYEGCICGIDRDHDGDHECIACDCTWDHDLPSE